MTTFRSLVALILGVTFLGGCEALRTIAPQTVAGFEANGLIGAVDGASGAILATCRTLDGQVIRVAVDGLALETGAGDLVERVRAARHRTCAIAGGVSVLAAAPVAPAD